MTPEHAGGDLSALRERVAVLEDALFRAAAHCQGGHSQAGEAISAALGVPFPVRMEGLEPAAIGRGLEPRDLWPWLFEIRARERRVALLTALEQQP